MTGIDLLHGTRVVDLAGAAAAYTGRMFADLGADVVLVEPPGGSESRQVPAHFAFMHAGKRSVTTDLAQTRGRELFSRLVTTSDVLVTTAAVGDMEALDLGYETLHRLVPRLVYTSVTPFGLTGPRRRWRGSDLVGWAASGALPSIGDPDRAPLAPGGGLAFMTGALNAAMGTLAALTARRRSGTGQLVDISLQEAVISVAMESGPMTVLEAGFTQTRTGKRRSGAPIGHYATRDGAVSVVAYMPDHWRALAEWIRDETGVEEVTADVFAGPPMARMHYGELIDALDRRIDGALHEAGVLRRGTTARHHRRARQRRPRRASRSAVAGNRWMADTRARGPSIPDPARIHRRRPIADGCRPARR